MPAEWYQLLVAFLETNYWCEKALDTNSVMFELNFRYRLRFPWEENGDRDELRCQQRRIN
jgi:hypothetical protein